VGLSGAGGIKASDLDKQLAGKRANSSPYIGLSSHGFNGSASPGELETALQLLYVQFTAPGDDPQAVALMQRQLSSMVANRGRNPGQVFGGSEPIRRSLPRGSRGRRRVVADREHARLTNTVCQRRFAVAGQRSRTGDTAGQYVLAAPSAEVVRLQRPRFPAGIEHEPSKRTQTGTARPSLLLPIADRTNRSGWWTTVLETSLRDLLREDLGKTYTV
jgi:hypothetical protein